MDGGPKIRPEYESNLRTSRLKIVHNQLCVAGEYAQVRGALLRQHNRLDGTGAKLRATVFRHPQTGGSHSAKRIHIHSGCYAISQSQ